LTAWDMKIAVTDKGLLWWSAVGPMAARISGAI
jgi:hypothetical protein